MQLKQNSFTLKRKCIKKPTVQAKKRGHKWPGRFRAGYLTHPLKECHVKWVVDLKAQVFSLLDSLKIKVRSLATHELTSNSCDKVNFKKKLGKAPRTAKYSVGTFRSMVEKLLVWPSHPQKLAIFKRAQATWQDNYFKSSTCNPKLY